MKKGNGNRRKEKAAVWPRVRMGAGGMAAIWLLVGVAFAPRAGGQDLGVALAATEPEYVQIYLGESFKLNVREVSKVVVSDPEIVEVVPVTTDVLVLNAKKSGSTTLTLFEAAAERVVRVLVVQNDIALAMRIKTAIGYPGVKVLIAEQNIVLEGEVEDQDERNRAITMASAFLPAVRQMAVASAPANNVYNNTQYFQDSVGEGDVSDAKAFKLETPEGIVDFLRVRSQRQIRLRIQVVSVTKGSLKDFGIRFDEGVGYAVGYQEFVFGPANTLFYGGDDGKIDDDGFSGDDWLGTQIRQLGHGAFAIPNSQGGLSIDGETPDGEGSVDSAYSVVLRTLENKGDARTLARPTLTTLDGAEASFLVGGKAIIPIVGGFAGSVQTEEYGVKVFFRPKIMANGNVNLWVTPKVSEQPTEVGDIIFVDSQNTRNNVEVPNGATVVLSGLFTVNRNLTVNKLPWLADIPILGELFKNKVNRDGDQEVFFLVTPEIVAAPVYAAVGADMPTETGDMKVWMQEKRVFSSMNPDVTAKGPRVNPRDFPDSGLPGADAAEEVDYRRQASLESNRRTMPEAAAAAGPRNGRKPVVEPVSLEEINGRAPSGAVVPKPAPVKPAAAPKPAQAPALQAPAAPALQEPAVEEPAAPESPLMNLPRPALPQLQPR